MKNFTMKIFVITIFIQIILYGVSLLSQDQPKKFQWYQDFYQTLANHRITSFKLMQIWVAPHANDLESAPLIGGNLKNFELWRVATEELLRSDAAYQDVWRGRFIYEIVVDEKTRHKHQALFDSWQELYAPIFKITLINDLQPDKNSPLAIGYQQCLSGVAAVCSDYLRFDYNLDSESDITVYMDIDTMSQALTKKQGRSAQILGADLREPGLYSVAFYDKNSSIHWNNDTLIFYNLSKEQQKKLRSILNDKLLNQKIAYDNILDKSHLNAISSFSDYQEKLKQRVLSFIQNDHQWLHKYDLILNNIGPGFYVDLLQQGLSHTYWHSASDFVEGYASWTDELQTNVCHFNTQVLRFYYDEETIHMLLHILLMLYDADYVCQKCPSWCEDFKEHLIYLLQQNESLIRDLPTHLKIVTIMADKFLKMNS
jgi:hypothetical protein